MWITRLGLAALAAATLIAPGAPAARAAPDPANGLRQDSGAAGCLSPALPACATAPYDWLDLASGLAVSSQRAFITSRNADRIVTASRDVTTGALTAVDEPTSCVAANPEPGCQDGHDLLGPTDVALDPSREFAYVSSQRSDSLTSFTVVDGQLHQLGSTGCSRYRGSEFGDGLCQEAGASMLMPADVEVSPDGRDVYVAARGSLGFDGEALESKPEAINVFGRNPATGAIAKLGGTQGCLSSNGKSGCLDADQIIGLRQTIATPDGRHLIALARGSVAVTTFARSPGTGALSQLESSVRHCASEDGSDGQCLKVPQLRGLGRLAVSPDSRSLYVTVRPDAQHAAVVHLRRDPVTGKLSKPSGALCFGDVAGCDPAGPLPLGGDVAVTGDGAAAYVSGASGITAFARSSSGELQTLAGQSGCIAEMPLGTLGCLAGRGVGGDARLAMGPEAHRVQSLGSWGAHEGVANLRRKLPPHKGS